MSLEEFLYGLYRLVTEPLYAVISSITFIVVGYLMDKPPNQNDFIGVALHPLLHKASQISLAIGFVVIGLFLLLSILKLR